MTNTDLPARFLVRRLGPALALLIGATALAGCSRVPPPVAKTANPDVVVELPVRRLVTEFEDFTGRTEGYKWVDIRPEVTGKLKEVHFKDGDFVTAGAPLFDIDDQLFKAQRDSAKAALGKADAQLIRAEASLVRARDAYAKGATGKEELDTKLGDRDVEKANVEAAKAHLVEIETTLSYTKITAPFTGRISRRKVDPGNTVKAHETILTTLIVLDPIYVSFDVDQRTVIHLRQLILEGKIASARSARLNVEVGLSDDGRTFKAVLTFADNVLDLNTGTLRLRAEMHNPSIQVTPVPFATWLVPPDPLGGLVGAVTASKFDAKQMKLLSPGMFVKVRFPVGREHEALLVPEEAVGSDQGQRFVYVRNANDEVIYRRVTLGPQEGRLRVVNEWRAEAPNEGVAPGEQVIVSGHQRVKPGIKVNAKTSGPPVVPAK